MTARRRRRFRALRRAGLAGLGVVLSVNLCLASGGHAPPATSLNIVTIGESRNGQTVGVRVGDVVELTLPENASSGWQWAVERCCEAERLERLPVAPRHAASAVGSGGEARFRFQVKRAGSARVELKYWRSFDGDASVAARFVLDLDAAP